MELDEDKKSPELLCLKIWGRPGPQQPGHIVYMVSLYSFIYFYFIFSDTVEWPECRREGRLK